MSYIIFRRESDNFDDIIKDPSLKKWLKFKVKFKQGLIIKRPYKDEIISYIELKYGESIVNNIVPDRTPIMNVDYLPKVDKRNR